MHVRWAVPFSVTCTDPVEVATSCNYKIRNKTKKVTKKVVSNDIKKESRETVALSSSPFIMDNLIWTAQTGPDLNLNEFCQPKIRKVLSKSDLPSPDLRLKFWVKSWQGIQSLYQNYFFKKIYALNLILILVSRLDLTWLNTGGKYRHRTWDWTRFSRLYLTMSAPVKIFHHENDDNCVLFLYDYGDISYL